MLLKILLSGDGGQGIQLLSHFICQAAFLNDWKVSHIPNYGLEQRGGVSLAYIKISDKDIVYPKFSKADILLIMSDQSRERIEQYQKEGVEVIDSRSFIDELNKVNIPIRSHNIFFLGLLTKMLVEKGVCKKDDIFNLLENKLREKDGWEDNKKAFELGYFYLSNNQLI